MSKHTIHTTNKHVVTTSSNQKSKPGVTATVSNVSEHEKEQIKDVFDAIWKADSSAIKPFHESRFPKNEFKGTFVVKICDTTRRNRDHKLFRLYKWNGHAYEPANNSDLLQHEEYKGFSLVNSLFDNYESDETKPEVNTKEECQEILDFLNHVVDSPPIKIAANYLRGKYSNSSALDQEEKSSFSNRTLFRNKLKKIWFDQYDWKDSKSLSGFEHTFVGERRNNQMLGYHFWFKYLTDDSSENHKGLDTIDFNKRMDDAATDDFISISFSNFEDIDGDGVIENTEGLFKSMGSFFVGCSAECMIALGTVAYYENKAHFQERRRQSNHSGDDDEGVEAVINGHTYKLSMHRGGNKHQHCRTFFPMKSK
jgi:poly(U)-specific endoribonuclease